MRPAGVGHLHLAAGDVDVGLASDKMAIDLLGVALLKASELLGQHAVEGVGDKNDITIEELLQHCAGVYDVVNDVVPGCAGKSFIKYQLSLNQDHRFSAEELIEQVAINNLSYFQPGIGYHYSNTGYTILGEIIARVYSFRSGTSKTYADYLYDYIVGSKSAVPLKIYFPYIASDNELPAPYVKARLIDTSLQIIDSATANMSAHVAEGNGYTTISQLNKFIRNLMKGENVLSAQTVQLMQKSFSAYKSDYALGCEHTNNLGYGHNGATFTGYFSLMKHDPDYDVSVIILLPLIDDSSTGAFINCSTALTDAAYVARSALGYPGKP